MPKPDSITRIDWLAARLADVKTRGAPPIEDADRMIRLSCTVTAAQYEWVMRAGGSRRVRELVAQAMAAEGKGA